MRRLSPEYPTDSRVFPGSISRWVPTRENPEGSDEQGVGVVGEVQRGHSGPSDRRLADDPQSIGGPAEMLGPELQSRIEQCGNLAGLRIPRHCPVGLVSIAQRAAQPEVGFLIGPPLRPGEDMFDLKASHHQVLWAQAVAATVSASYPHPTVDFDR